MHNYHCLKNTVTEYLTINLSHLESTNGYVNSALCAITSTKGIVDPKMTILLPFTPNV